MKLVKKLSLALLFCCTQIACQPNQQSSDGAQVNKETFRWKLVTAWPKNFPGLGTGPERFANMVGEMSAGQLTIKVYGAGEVVPAMEVFDAVSRGTAQMGHSAAYYWKGKVPEAQFFTAVPFGLNVQEMNGWLHYGGGMVLWRELYAPFNLIPFAGGSTGVQMAGWFNKEINNLSDLKGIKMRIPGLGAEVLSRLGGAPVTLPGGELFTALQTGSIDATEWVGPYNDQAFGLHQAAKYYYSPGWHEPGPVLEFIANKTKLEALPKHLQAIIEHAARAVNQDMLDEYTARNHTALRQLIDEHKVQMRTLPKEVYIALHKTSDEVVKDLAEKSKMSKKIYQSYSAFKKDVENYHRLSEKAYYNARDW